MSPLRACGIGDDGSTQMSPLRGSRDCCDDFLYRCRPSGAKDGWFIRGLRNNCVVFFSNMEISSEIECRVCYGSNVSSIYKGVVLVENQRWMHVWYSLELNVEKRNATNPKICQFSYARHHVEGSIVNRISRPKRRACDEVLGFAVFPACSSILEMRSFGCNKGLIFQVPLNPTDVPKRFLCCKLTVCGTSNPSL